MTPRDSRKSSNGDVDRSRPPSPARRKVPSGYGDRGDRPGGMMAGDRKRRPRGADQDPPKPSAGAPPGKERLPVTLASMGDETSEEALLRAWRFAPLNESLGDLSPTIERLVHTIRSAGRERSPYLLVTQIRPPREQEAERVVLRISLEAALV